MCSVRVFGMAMVAALMPLAALAPKASGASSSNSNPQPNSVKCLANEPSKQVTISAPGTVVVECPEKYTFDPEVTKETEQQVYDPPKCTDKKPLTSCCPDATLGTLPGEGEPSEGLPAKVQAADKVAGTSGATLTIKTLPVDRDAVFCVRCSPPEASGVPGGVREDEQKQPCVVMVTVKKAPPQGGESGAGGGTAVVHICRLPSASISVSVPDKGSAVQFACENKFKLYPSDAKRVFKDDCKTEEDLKDMTRTHAATSAPPAPAAPSGAPQAASRSEDQSGTIYTLKADRKPPKRRLCYLCASQRITAPNQGTAEDYCTIYVESSARTQCDLCLVLALTLSYVVAGLPYT